MFKIKYKVLLMDKELTSYVENIKERVSNKNERVTMYYKEGAKLVKFLSDNSAKTIEKSFKQYVKNNGYDEDDMYIRISHGFDMKNYTHGPMYINCEILYISDKGKVNMKKSKFTTVYYTLKELKNRGYKIGDYKRLFNRLNKGTFENGFKNIYTAKNLD